MSIFDNKFSFEEALKCDQMIHHLATYEVSGGMIFMPKNMQELMDFQKKVAEKFNYFKHLVQSGEISLEELCGSVADRNGPFYNKKRNMTDDELNEELIKTPDESSIPTEEFFNLIGKMFAGENDKKCSNLKIIPLPPEFAGEGGFRKLLGRGKIAEKDDSGENNEENKNSGGKDKSSEKDNGAKNKRTRGKNKI